MVEEHEHGERDEKPENKAAEVCDKHYLDLLDPLDIVTIQSKGVDCLCCGIIDIL